MRVDLFDFYIPDHAIALRPQEPRESGRLLLVHPDAPVNLSHKLIQDLPSCLRPGDALVVNDTKVIPARLMGSRQRGSSIARIEILLHQRASLDSWWVFARPAKKLHLREEISFQDAQRPDLELIAEVEEKREDGQILLRFSASGTTLDTAITQFGTMPLPPYIAKQRPADMKDHSDYQTLFAEHSGSVAAPTAGLHFTPELIATLKEKNISFHSVTLHVGAGTFLPVKSEDTQDHHMHKEYAILSPEVAHNLNAIRSQGGRIVAVGTTSLRVLESAVDTDGVIRPFRGETDIFITPSFTFRAVDILMTNFHLPRSTLFMLVCAFSGLDCMKQAYTHAIEQGYRFYSYGDACLLHRKI